MVIDPTHEQAKNYTVQVINLNTSELHYFKGTISAISCTGKLTYITDSV